MNCMLVFYGGMYALFFDSFTQHRYSMAFTALAYVSIGLIINNIITCNGYKFVGNLTVNMKQTLFYELFRHILKMPSFMLRQELQGNIISIVT